MKGRRIVGVSPVATDTIFLNVRGQPDSAVTRMASQRYARRYHYTSAGLPDLLYGYGGVTLTTRGYGWDVPKGVLTGIKLGTSLTSISPDAALQDSSIVLPGTAGTIGRTFGSLHAPVKLTSPQVERWLGFDGVGRINRHLNQGGQSGRFFVYDSLGRFQKAADSSTTGTPPVGCPDLVGSLFCTLGLTWTFTPGTLRADTMDVVGNRTSKGGTYTAGTNRITAFDGCTYVTDAAGSDSVRTCAGTVTTFGWNKEGQLTSLAVTGQPTATFDYDAFGRLVRRSSGGSAVSHFLWDGGNLLAEIGSAGTSLTAEYSYYPGMDRLHAIIVGATRHYAFADGLGNLVRLTSESGTFSRSFTYDDWGQITSTTDNASLGSKDRSRWKGALWFGEETELYFMRNRWYEPRTGRFLSEDPLGLSAGTNPSAFAGGDPINFGDPLGTCRKIVTSIYKLGADGTEILWKEDIEFDCSGDGMRHGSWGGAVFGPGGPITILGWAARGIKDNAVRATIRTLNDPCVNARAAAVGAGVQDGLFLGALFVGGYYLVAGYGLGGVVAWSSAGGAAFAGETAMLEAQRRFTVLLGLGITFGAVESRMIGSRDDGSWLNFYELPSSSSMIPIRNFLDRLGEARDACQ